MAGRPLHRRAGLVLLQWRQVPAPRVQETGAPIVVAGGARAKRTPGYLHCTAWPTVAPIGSKLGASEALDSGPLDKAVHVLVVGLATIHSTPQGGGPGGARRHERALRGGRAHTRSWPVLSLAGDGEHSVSMAIPPPQQGEALVPPQVSGECPRDRDGMLAPLPSAPTTWSMCHEQKKLVAGCRPAGVGGRWRGRGDGGGGMHPAASCTLLAIPWLGGTPCRPRQRQLPFLGGGGCESSLPRSRPRPGGGAAAALRLLGPLHSRHRPTLMWDPLPPPKCNPTPAGTKSHHLATGRPGGLWTYGHPLAT